MTSSKGRKGRCVFGKYNVLTSQCKKAYQNDNKKLLRCPVKLLLLYNCCKEPFFLRAFLFVLYEAKTPDGMTSIQDDNSNPRVVSNMEIKI